MAERIWHELNSMQAEGLACVVCGAGYLSVPTPHVPVGRSQSGSQVFACQGRCAEHTAQATDMARWATVASLLTEGHPLIVGRPGQGKTAAIRALLWAALAEHGTPVVVSRQEAPELSGPGQEETGGEPR